VRRGLAPSREQARAAIEADRVTVDGAPARKAAHMVGPGEVVAVAGPGPRFVGRGGEKLAAALDRFAIDPRGGRALDAGSSTGGFTDCLLQAGAASVVAVDVGRNQLHERLRADRRVESRERTDVRDLAPPAPGEAYPLVVADVSFISLRTVAAALLGQVAAGGDLVVLVKPQFEVGREDVSKGRGVVTDPELWRQAIVGVVAALEAGGAAIMDLMVSPLTGADGNVEFLLHARAGRPPSPSADLVDAALADAVRLRP
jgi:23S rRNA (cytidine1920-2'-O)/16S rRNA (cytidine1409-2'-O)-methyltransferase